jgi:peptidyl-Lys metalloendopeptidase
MKEESMHLSKTLIVAAIVAGGHFLSAQLAVSLTPMEDTRVRFTITNTSDKKVSFLRYQTPMDEFEANLFLVERDGATVTYTGKMALRLRPTANDYVTLDPHESVNALVDLGEAYDLGRGGNYTARFRYPISVKHGKVDKDNESRLAMEAQDDSDNDAQEVESNAVSFFTAGNEYQARSYKAPLADVERGFSGCTSSQQSAIKAAVGPGRSLASGAYYAVGNTSRYKTWFGTYTSSRASFVKSSFAKIYNSFGHSWTYNCINKPGVYAYVYPSRPYQVWVSTPLFGTNTRFFGSVLLHEASHWNINGGTNDYAYYGDCLQLAKTSPDRAIHNADSYRQFAYN